MSHLEQREVKRQLWLANLLIEYQSITGPTILPLHQLFLCNTITSLLANTSIANFRSWLFHSPQFYSVFLGASYLMEFLMDTTSFADLRLYSSSTPPPIPSYSTTSTRKEVEVNHEMESLEQLTGTRLSTWLSLAPRQHKTSFFPLA